MIKKLIGINYNTSGTSGTSGVSGTTNVTVSTSGISGSSGTAGTTGTTFVGSQTDIYSGNSVAQTWSKPSGAKVVEVICIGAGGSGGSGSVNASNRFGGCGGAGGGYSRMIFNASSLPSTVNALGGRGFSGGASKTIVSNGNNGSTGADSYFGDYLRATGGAGGLGGSSGEGFPTIGGYGVIENGGDGGVVGGLLADTTSNTKYAPSGGGAGGDGFSFAVQSGSAGGTVRLQINTQGAGGSTGLPGSTASSYTNQLMGAGGGGGGAGSGTNGGGGANGLLYGAGGGGGGSSNGTSGAGGSGANGVVIVITYF